MSARAVVLSGEQWAMVIAGLSGIAAQYLAVAESAETASPHPIGHVARDDLTHAGEAYRALAGEVRGQLEYTPRVNGDRRNQAMQYRAGRRKWNGACG